MPVTIPATGSGTATPIVSTDNVTADSSQVQNVQLTTVSGGVLTRLAPALDATLASILAKQPSLGTAGSPSTNVISVQGVASGTVLPVSGTVTTTPPANASTNLAQVAGSSTAVGHGAAATALRVELPTDGTGVVGITGTVPLPTGASTEATLAAASGKLPATLGQKAMAASMAVVLASDQSAIPVTGGGTPTDTTATGSLTGTGQVTASSLNSAGTAIIDLTGTWSATNIVEVTVDGSNWITCPTLYTLAVPTTMIGTGNASANGDYVVPMAGFVGVRLRCAAFVSGTIVVFIRASAANETVRSTAVSGNVAITAAALPLPSGASTAAKQPALGTAGALSTDVISVGLPVTTAGGYTIHRLLAAGTTNATSVKGSAGQVFGWYLANAAAYTVFLKFYNSASAPTPGSGTPVMTIPIPAGAAANVEFVRGIQFATGIAYDTTKLVADADTTVLVANDLVINLFYA